MMIRSMIRMIRMIRCKGIKTHTHGHIMIVRHFIVIGSINVIGDITLLIQKG